MTVTECMPVYCVDQRHEALNRMVQKCIPRKMMMPKMYRMMSRTYFMLPRIEWYERINVCAL